MPRAGAFRARSPAANDRRTDRLWLVAIGVVTLVAFGLRAWGFRQSLLGDELFAYAEIRGQSLAGGAAVAFGP